jgi:hypothetical protein
MLKALPLGDFLKDIKDIISGEVTGLLSSVTLAVGTTSAKALKVGANLCVFAGVNVQKAESEVAFTADTHDVAVDKLAAFRVSVDSSGAITITKGDDQDTEALALENIPAVPVGEADLGYFIVTGSFDATTDDLAATFYPADDILTSYDGIDE